jgi:hypothetical protein
MASIQARQQLKGRRGCRDRRDGRPFAPVKNQPKLVSVGRKRSHDWYPLAEKEVTLYLRGPEASLGSLKLAIDREAEASPRYATFWTTVQEFVRRFE